MSSLRTTAVAAVALVAALILPMSANGAHPAGTAAAPGGKTKVIADCVHRTVKPRRVTSACGDANEYAVVKRYGSWGAEEGWGSGRLHMNDCDPDCASGTMHSYKATFRFHRVVDTAHGPLFRRLGVTYIKGGEEKNTELALPRRPLGMNGADMARVRSLRTVCC